MSGSAPGRQVVTGEVPTSERPPTREANSAAHGSPQTPSAGQAATTPGSRQDAPGQPGAEETKHSDSVLGTEHVDVVVNDPAGSDDDETGDRVGPLRVQTDGVGGLASPLRSRSSSSRLLGRHSRLDSFRSTQEAMEKLRYVRIAAAS